MSRSIVPLAALALLALAETASAQEPAISDAVRYTIGWDNPASQLYEVAVSASAHGEPIVFSLPAWRPGRYIVQNYAANVQGMRAMDDRGNPLPAEWIDLDSWRVDPGTAQSVTLAYEYYARTFDAGSSTLTPAAAYFNPVNLLPWVEGRKDSPVTLTLEAPADWVVATQLERRPGPGHAFAAPDYDRLVDSPTIAAPDLLVWDYEVDGATYHLVFRNVKGELQLGDFTKEKILADVARLTQEAVAVFGVTPFDEYWHLFQLVPYPFGHAVEHESSASYVVQDAIFASADGYDGFLSILAHEFVHAWNVKRIRPAALWPYDYSAPQLTRLHWVTEGVTSYYEAILLARAGLLDEAGVYTGIANNIRALQASPGRLVTSAELSSLTSWHTGYGDGNPNQAISFYLKGSLLGLLLDLTIRDATDGARGLDDVMRLLWERYYEQGRGYPEDGFQSAAAEVAGRSLDDFFSRYVSGTEELPYAETLGIVGLTAKQEVDAGDPVATFGWRLRKQGDDVTISNVLPDGPALSAGILRDDILVSVEGEATDGVDLEPFLSLHAPGDVVTVTVRRMGEEIEKRVTLADGGNLEWSVGPVESPTERQLRLRQGWLSSRTGSAGP
ncbi:MAG TPA: PDZ domain-containing protein [Gemmatimonadota bacterium]|nr:PDZ domain-containing protein [Gemmatimonadota bacterium]